MDPYTTISHLVHAFLPPDLASSIQTHILRSDSPFQRASLYVKSMLYSILHTVQPIVQPVIDRVLLLLSENQGLTGLATLVLVIISAVMVLQWVQRVIVWWTRLAMRLVLWGAVVALGAFVWQRGVYLSFRDAVVLGGKLLGYLASMREVWESEYDRYSRQQAEGAPNMGAGRGSGMGGAGGGGANRGKSSWR